MRPWATSPGLQGNPDPRDSGGASSPPLSVHETEAERLPEVSAPAPAPAPEPEPAPAAAVCTTETTARLLCKGAELVDLQSHALSSSPAVSAPDRGGG